MTENAQAVEKDMSWIDIAVCRNATVVIRYSPGWDEFIDELHFEDVFATDVPDLPAGMYRWSGYKVGYWGEDDHINVTGGTFEPYALATSDAAYRRGKAEGISVAAEAAESNRTDDDSMWDRAAHAITTAIRALSPASGAERSNVPTDAITAEAARLALGRWLAWPDAARDGPVETDNAKVCSWLQGVPAALAAAASGREIFADYANKLATPPADVEEAVREKVARIIDPAAWAQRANFQRIIAGEGRMPSDPDQRAMHIRSATRRVDAVVADSLARADAILSDLDEVRATLAGNEAK